MAFKGEWQRSIPEPKCWLQRYLLYNSLTHAYALSVCILHVMFCNEMIKKKGKREGRGCIS